VYSRSIYNNGLKEKPGRKSKTAISVNSQIVGPCAKIWK